MLDYIIVGQGLVGSILAFKLSQQGKTFKIIDNNHAHASSKLAAGLVNPITGRRFLKSWMIDDLLPVAKKTYQDIESQLSIRILRERCIHRSLISIEAENDWHAKTSIDGYKDYIKTSDRLEEMSNLVKDQYLYARIENCYQVDLKLFIDQYRHIAMQNEYLIEEQFDYDKLNIGKEKIQYKGLSAKRIVFCEGYKAIENPFFKYLPFGPVKGEVIHFKLQTAIIDSIVKHIQYIVPQSDGVYWSGGGYNWSDISQNPTSQYLEKWKNDMNGYLKTPYKIINHQAGVRPATQDRKPLLGRHPKYKALYILNGMGTKGTSLAPYFTNELLSFIHEGKPILNHVNIRRARNIPYSSNN